MVFNSLTFIAFFACVLLLHSLPFSWTTKKINLLIASYLFYSAWNPPFVILLWVSTVVDWYAAQGLVKSRRASARHAWMLLSVVANLGMLGYFKYGQFLLDNFSALMAGSALPGSLRTTTSFSPLAYPSIRSRRCRTRWTCTCAARNRPRTCSTTLFS
jgi:D-alanyl-lipoteichoic acid acyltransferase DltB (MBOAT superfamily)